MSVSTEVAKSVSWRIFLIINILILTSLLFFSCVKKTKQIEKLSQVCDASNMGASVEIKGYIKIPEGLTCIAKNGGSTRCLYGLGSDFDGKEMASILLIESHRSASSINAMKSNIEELVIKDFQKKELKPREGLILNGIVKPLEEFSKSSSTQCMVKVNRIRADESAPKDKRYCQESQWTHGNLVYQMKGSLQDVVGRFQLKQTEPKDPYGDNQRIFCNSIAEVKGTYLGEKKDNSKQEIAHLIADYQSWEKATRGVREHLEIEKNNGAEMDSEIRIDSEKKTIKAFYQKMVDDNIMFYKTDCYPESYKYLGDVHERFICHKFMSYDRSVLDEYADSWFKGKR